MPIAVECPSCGKRYKMNDSLAGDTVPCKECGEDIDVPGGRRRGSGGKRRGRSQNDPNQMLMIAGAGGGVAIVGVLAFLVFGRGGGNPPPPPNPNQDQIVAANSAPPVATPPSGMPTTPPPQFGPGQANSGSGQKGNSNPNPNPNPNPNSSIRPPAPSGGGGMGRDGSLNLPGNKDAKANFGPNDSKPDDKNALSSHTSDWKAEPDPQPEPPTLELSRKVSIKFPTERPDKTSVLFPHVPSPIVAVGDNHDAKSSRDIWNLATNSKIGTMKGMTFSSEEMALSPDGAYVAAAFQANVDVWDVKAKKSLGRFSLGKGPWGVKFLEFTRADRLLGIGANGEAKLLKLPSGEVEREFTLPPKSDAKVCGISPNGRYLAFAKDDWNNLGFELMDLDSDDVVGSIAIKKGNGQPNYKVTGIAFSPNGGEVAAVLDDGWNHVGIMVWNMKDGEEVDSMILDEILVKGMELSHWSKDTPLQWFPGGTRWLYKGHGIVDRVARQIVFRIPNSEFEVMASRRPLTDAMVSVVDGKQANASFLGFTLKEDILAKASESVASGGLPGDAALPPLTKPDWSGIEDVTFADRDGQWKVNPDPAPEPAEKLLLRAMPLKQGKGEVRQVSVSRADAARLYARVVEGDGKSGLRDETNIKETWMDVYDLVARKPTNKIKMPLPFEMLAVSPEGTHVLCQTTKAVGRIDVYSDDGKHVCGWRPYQDEANENQREVVGAAFVDASHLATVNAGNKLVMWQLPECKAIYGIANAALPSLTQGTKYLTYADVNTYDFRDALTGKSVGEIRVEDGKGIAAVSFHPNGERMAILLDDHGSTYLLHVDLRTGQSYDQIPVPADYGPIQAEAKDAYVTNLERMQAMIAKLHRGQNQGSRALGATMPMHWCGDDYLLLNNYRLFDVRQKLVVWQYALPVGAHLSTSSDGRHWYVTTKTGKSGAPPYLAAQSLPDKFALKEIGGQTLEPGFVLTPGMTIGIEMRLMTPPNMPNFASDVWMAIEKAFARNNVKFAENQPLKLLLTMEQKSRGSIDYRSRQTGNVTNVQEQTIVCTAALESGGKRHWEVGTQSSNYMWRVYLYGNETLESKLTDALWTVPSKYFQRLFFPAYVFDKVSTDGRGVSILTVDGTDKSP